MTNIPTKIMIQVIITYKAFLTHTHYNLLQKGNKKMLTLRQEAIDNPLPTSLLSWKSILTFTSGNAICFPSFS